MAEQATDRGWDRLFKQLGNREVMRLVSKAGGRAAARTKAVGVKVLRPDLPRKTGALQKGLKGVVKKSRDRRTGLWVWKVIFRSTVAYWGTQVKRQKVKEAYIEAQREAAEWWRKHADKTVSQVFREGIKK